MKRINKIKNSLICTFLMMGILFINPAKIQAQSYASWYNQAQDRIDTLRKGDFGIQVFDKNGNPYSGEVKVRMKKHEYPFGIAFDFYEGSASMGNTYSTSNTVQADADAEIYQTERWNDYLAYSLPVESGKDYQLTLKFAEIFHSAASLRLFDVLVKGQLLLEDFDTYSAAGGNYIAFDTTIEVTSESSAITIELISSVDNAAIKGIALVEIGSIDTLRINCGGPSLITASGHSYVSEEGFFDPNFATVASKEQWMKATMYKYFNSGVTGNSFKWSGIQPQHTKPDYTNFENSVQWTQKVGWDLRGHNLLWGGADDHSMPGWVRNQTPQAITDTCKMRVQREMTRYKGIIKEYDVINEPLTGHADSLRKHVGDSIIWNCFKWAHEADPDAELYINDYNVEYNWGQAREYRDLILKIKEMGGPVTGVGMQAHFWDCCRPNVDELVNNVNIVAEAGLPIKFTEYDFGGNLSQEQQAADFIKVLTIAFSHPSIVGMISWGLSDDGAWRENTGFFDANHKPKIAADSLLYYTKTKWATNFDSEMNNGAVLNFNAYYGDYEIEVSFGDTVKVFTVPCTKENESVIFSLYEEDSQLKGPQLIGAELVNDLSIRLAFDKAVNSSTMNKSDFKFFSNDEIGIAGIQFDENDPASLLIDLSKSVTKGDYISISYFPGSLEGSDGSMVDAFGPEGIYNPPAPILTSSGSNLEEFRYVVDFGPSDYQSFTVSGENLVDDINIQASENFELSSAVDEGFTGSLKLLQDDGQVVATRIYVRLKSDLNLNIYEGKISISSAGAEISELPINGKVGNAPELQVSDSELNDFIYTKGSGPSGSKSFTVSGSSLFEDLSIQSPNNFEITLDSTSAFSQILTVDQNNGDLATTNIYVRLKSGLPVNEYEGDIVISTFGITSPEIRLSGSVQESTGIVSAEEGSPSVISRRYYSINGSTLLDIEHLQGIFIEILQMSDGTIRSSKIVRMNRY